MKKTVLALTIISLCLCIVGCGNKPASYNESTLIFDKKGAVKDIIVEPFDKDYYTEQGLTTFFNEAISEFSIKYPAGVVLLSDILVEDGIARATLNFDDVKTYKEFYGADVFWGTISDAYDNGYNMDVTLKSTSSDKTIGKSEIMDMAKKPILIIDEPICVKTAQNIKFASANVEIINGKLVRISSDSSGLAYLILE